MSKFLKAKNASSGDALLIAVSQIAAVEASGKGTEITLLSGDSVETDLGFQSVSNRLKELGSDIA